MAAMQSGQSESDVTPYRAVLAVSPKVFSIIWWGIQLFHGLCIANAIATIEIHRYFIVHDLGITIDYLGPKVFSYFKPVIAANLLLIVGHGITFLRTMWWSIKHREWRFTDLSTTIVPQDVERRATFNRQYLVKGSSKLSHHSQRSINQNDSVTQSTWTFKITLVVKRLLRVFATVGTALYRQIDKFSIEGSYYEIVFFTLEVVEISFQTFQAFKLSGLVPRVWINRLYAIVLVLNCWSTVIVHTALRHNRLVKRVLLLFVDGFFDMITSMVIPFVIIYPYYQQFDLTIVDFPLVNYYDDVWLIQAISENQQVFVTSWPDFISKMSTSFSIWATMLVLKHYLVMDNTKIPKANQVLQVPKHVAGDIAVSPSNTPRSDHSAWCTRIHEGLARSVAVVPEASVHENQGDNNTARSVSERPVIESTLSRMKNLSWKDYLLIVYGIVILVIHVHATVIAVNSNVNGCLLHVRPWFKTTYTCVALEINCAQGQFDNGLDVDAMNQLATQLSTHGVKSFVISSCAQFHVPRLVQAFSAMQMMKVYNTTIDRWDAYAALHQDLHYDFQMLYFCDSNFTAGELPTGMLGDHSPSRFVDIEFSGTNLQRLPSDLYQKWPFIYYFVLERSPGIREIPDGLMAMKVADLFLGSNAITSIPDDLLAEQAFWLLRLDGNPLTKLPEDIGAIEGLHELGFSFTYVSSLPRWMTTKQYDALTGDVLKPSVDVYAGESPLCLDLNGTAEASRDTGEDYFHWDCSTQMPPYSYPVEQERRWRAASTARQEYSTR